jgi:hypothetical protein
MFIVNVVNIQTSIRDWHRSLLLSEFSAGFFCFGKIWEEFSEKM